MLGMILSLHILRVKQNGFQLFEFIYGSGRGNTVNFPNWGKNTTQIRKRVSSYIPVSSALSTNEFLLYKFEIF